LAPIQDKTTIEKIIIQKIVFLKKMNLTLNLMFFVIGTKITKIEKIKAKIPPTLFGIHRKIAYENKKYHSG
jgi:hypothetical protein